MANKNLEKEIDWLLREKYPHDQKIGVGASKDIKRIEKGEPLDYVIGFTNFLGCKIDLSKKPLIPRSETEFWTEKAIEEIKQLGSPTSLRPSGQNLRILDVFAGSGCIGIAVLKHINNAKVDFIDIEKKNLEQIRINCKLNNINPKRYKIIQANVFNVLNPSLPDSQFSGGAVAIGKYDYIFANPPYIAEKRKNMQSIFSSCVRGRKINFYSPHLLENKIQKSVLDFEPHEALFGGGDGFLYIKKFLKDAKKHLNPDGKIFMEFDFIQKKEIEKLFARQNFLKKNLGGREKNGYQGYEFHKDQYNKWRWLSAE